MQINFIWPVGTTQEVYVKRTDTIRQLKDKISPQDSPNFQVQLPTTYRPGDSEVVQNVPNLDDGVTLDISALSPPI